MGKALKKKSPAPITIMPASRQHVIIIAELAHRIWPVCYKGILTKPQIDNMLERIYSSDHLMQEMADGHRFWIAYHKGQPAGYISGYRQDEQIIWLKKIYVDVSLQGLGIGRTLIDTLIEAFQPANEMRLLVNPYNTPAHRYYQHMGFEKIGVMPVRMGDWNFDDFIFSKSITHR